MSDITESELDQFIAAKRGSQTRREFVKALIEERDGDLDLLDFYVDTAEYRAEVRDKYNADERDKAAKAGQAMAGGSYPIKDKDDLEKAIKAVGRGNASHNAIRVHIMARAKALGLSSLIPDNWQADGEAKSAGDDTEKRLQPGNEMCATCAGTGEVENDVECADCDGSGEVEMGGQQENNATDGLERRKAVAALIDGTVERRDFAATDVEIRTTSDGGLRFTGYASTTETPYDVADFTETIARGAFKRTLGQDPDVVLLVNHEGLPLARTRSGTLTLSEDTRGLRVDADLEPSDPDVQSLLPKMKRGDLTEMSFAFRATQQDWDEDYTKRTIREVVIDKGDVSMVTHGANNTTTGTISLRSAEAGFELRLDEDRVGKKHSKATEAEIDAAIEHLQKLKVEANPPEPEAIVDPLAVIIPRSSVLEDELELANAIARAA